MVKRILKRYASLLMIAALVLTTIPIIVFPAFAASTSGTVTGLSDANIGLSFNGEVEDPWTAAGTTITGSATNATTCENNPKKESKLTIKNKSSSVAKLIFKYDVTLNSGSVTIDGTTVTSAGTFSKEIGAGGSIIVDLIAGDKSKATVVTISDIQLILKKTVTATFKAPQHGSYTVNGTQITSDWVNTGSSFDPYTVSATPDSGYIFMGWYNAETMRSISTDASCSLSLNSDCTVMPKFVSNSAALFTAVGKTFDDIDEASEYAAANKQSTVILSKSGTYDKNSTVPSGITLLIPFDAANTVYTTAPEYVETAEAQSAYKTLTLKSGATITVNGVLSVSGKHLTASTEYCSRPTGAYGHIKTEAGSKIIVNANARLYAWGYISGEGEVIANSGSAVYEYFQIADWRGGSVTSSLLGNKEKVFPFSQYFVQNIEASLILKGGADEYTYLTLTAGSGIAKQTKSTSIHFVGKSGAMFNMTDGSELTKYYSPSTDRTHFITKGNVSLKSISLTVSVNTVDSSKYVLPINNNVSLEIKSGTASICQDVALQPGVNITIDNGAEVKINKGYKLYVYDKAEWSESYVWKSSNGGIRSVYYTTTSHAKRTLTNTVLNVNGALTAEGEIYTTKSGAEIISDGSTGVFNQVSAPGKDTKTNQYRQSDKSFVSIPITAAKLKNVNGTFTETASASAGDSIKFVNKEWGGKEPVYVTVTFNPNFSGIAEKTQSVESGVDTKLETNSFSRTGYTFKGWNTSADGSGTAYANGATVNVSKDTVLYAQWEVNTYTVTWKNGDTVLQSTKVAYGTKPAYTGATPTKPATAQYTYSFKGWSPEIVAVTGDTTYTAEFNSVLREYTVTWKNGDTVLQSGKVAYGTKPAYTGATPTKAATAQYTYTFKGWTPEIVAVTGDTTYTAEFNSVLREYTVTWMNGDTVLQSGKVAYGENPTYTGETPTKAATAQYTYVFKGWSPAVSNVTGDATYTAVFDEIVNEYTVTWMNGDTVLATDSVPYGDMPVYSGKTPVKEETSRYTYSFNGWTPEITDVTGNVTYTAVFDENGKNGLCVDGSDTYWIMNGQNVDFPGLIRINVGTDDKPHYHYYYFAEDGKAVKDGTYKVNKNNGLPLPEFNYDFDAEGVIVHDDDTSKNGICDGDGSKFYYVDGIKSGVGLIKVGDSYYYARTSTAEIVRNRTYWISNTNDLSIEPGMYHFDDDGRMILNGFISDNAGTYYFVNGTTLKGFAKIGDDYYIFNSYSGKMYKDATMWVGSNDYGFASSLYYFCADGKMSVPDTENGKKAIVEKNGKLYFTIDGAYMTSGLYELDGEYYYVQNNGELAANKTVWVDKKNGLIPEKGNWYAFDESGKLIKTGFVNGSDGYIYYYNDTVLALGFNKIGDDYYIFNSYSGKMYKDAEMWVGDNGYGIVGGMYYFDKDGKITLTDAE